MRRQCVSLVVAYRRAPKSTAQCRYRPKAEARATFRLVPFPDLAGDAPPALCLTDAPRRTGLRHRFLVESSGARCCASARRCRCAGHRSRSLQLGAQIDLRSGKPLARTGRKPLICSRSRQLILAPDPKRDNAGRMFRGGPADRAAPIPRSPSAVVAVAPGRCVRRGTDWHPNA